MCCCRKMEKISWTDRVRNEGVLQRFKEESDIIHKINRRKTNWISHIVLKHVTEGKVEG